MTTERKIPGAVIPRRVFTQPVAQQIRIFNHLVCPAWPNLFYEAKGQFLLLSSGKAGLLGQGTMGDGHSPGLHLQTKSRFKKGEK
jgi:hypothetical protein